MFPLVFGGCSKSMSTGKSGPNLRSDSLAAALLVRSHRSALSIESGDITDLITKINKGKEIEDKFGNNYIFFYIKKRDALITVSLGPDEEFATGDDEVSVRGLGRK